VACVFAVVGCQHSHPAADGAIDSPPDVDFTMCSSPSGTANITMQLAGSTTLYDRLFAGGDLRSDSGPAPWPLHLDLVFANTSPITSDMALFCGIPSNAQCGIDAVSAYTPGDIPLGTELGVHPVTVAGVTFTTAGTVTITDWTSPAPPALGHVAGSFRVSTDTVTIDGTFDNAFCAGMLTVPL
jgi:hypothetical protein